MLKLKRIRFKNILSFGDMWTGIEFEDKKNVLVQGQNGTGKSACILDTICFALYGKPFRKITKTRLVNNRNRKDMVVEIELSSTDGSDYFIRRGLNPQIFEIYKNGDLVPLTAAMKDYQMHLEKNILGIDFQSFTQIVILGKATYVAFLRLSAGARREFLEQILNLTIFSRMNEVNKTKYNLIRNLTSEYTNNIRVVREKIALTKTHIKTLEDETRRAMSEQLADVDNEIENLINDIQINTDKRSKLLSEIVEGVDGKVDAVESKLRKCNEYTTKFDSKLSHIKKRLSFFEKNDICPTCESELTEEVKSTKINVLISKEEELSSGKKQLDERSIVIENEFQEIKAVLDRNNQLVSDIRNIDYSIRALNTRIDNLRLKREEMQNVNGDAISSQKEELVVLLDEENDLLDGRFDLTQSGDCHDFINTMLKDSGIKSSIIKSRIPSITKIMNGYLKDMGLFVRFELDENFEETLYVRGNEPQTYQAFSEGEKLRIDLAMLMTWREISKLQSNVAFNVLIFDEILDASLDEDGAGSLVTLFRQIGYEGSTVIVISHSASRWEDKFSESWRVEKNGGFSKIVVDQTG